MKNEGLPEPTPKPLLIRTYPDGSAMLGPEYALALFDLSTILLRSHDAEESCWLDTKEAKTVEVFAKAYAPLARTARLQNRRAELEMQIAEIDSEIRGVK